MPYSITCSTKILTLAIAPFLFISWCSLWICYGARCVKVHCYSWGRRCTHSSANSFKIFKPLFLNILLCQGYCWIETNTNNWVTVLIIRPSSTWKLQFAFGFSECLWTIFSLLSFENFWIYIWFPVVWLLILRHRCLYFLSHLLPAHPCPWIKNLSAKTTKCIPKQWEKSVKSSSNLNSIRVIKNSYFDQHFLHVYDPNLSKNSLVTISCPPLLSGPLRKSPRYQCDMK